MGQCRGNAQQRRTSALNSARQHVRKTHFFTGGSELRILINEAPVPVDGGGVSTSAQRGGPRSSEGRHTKRVERLNAVERCHSFQRGNLHITVVCSPSCDPIFAEGRGG